MVRKTKFKHTIPVKFSLIHPSRGRPQKAIETAQNWLNKAGNVDVEWILSLDLDDPALLQYSKALGDYSIYKLCVNDNGCAVKAINKGATYAKGDILIVLSDDFDCPDNWGEQLETILKGKEDFILKTQDGTQGWMITLPIMDRKYYERFGYIYYPEYRHMFCDTELTCVADLTSRKLTSKLLFKHNHYSVTSTKPDDTARRADRTWDQGEKLFISRYKINFGLENPTGKITDKGYINWINSKI